MELDCDYDGVSLRQRASFKYILGFYVEFSLHPFSWLDFPSIDDIWASEHGQSLYVGDSNGMHHPNGVDARVLAGSIKN